MAEDVLQVPKEYYDLNDSDNTCFLCGQPNYDLIYRVNHFDFPFEFKRCHCGLEKQCPMPNEKFFEWFFNSNVFFSSKETEKNAIWGYYDYFRDEPSRLATSKWRFKKLTKIFGKKRPLDIMKIGPATGTFLHTAQLYGHNVRGCDVSNQFAEYARVTYGVTIDHGRYENMPYRDEQFDVIMLLNVIENVPNQAEFLLAIYRTLKADGYFVVNFVDMSNNLIAKLQKSKYFLYRPPICYGYSKPVFEKVMSKFGFEVVSYHKDVRFMHLEKILTLLRKPRLLSIAKFLRIDRINFPLYAYPSKLAVIRKKSK